jgi:hypothetical protein
MGLVSYMSLWNRTAKSPKSLTHSSLLIAGESTLSHPPGCLVSNRATHSASNPAGYSPRHWVRSSENYSGGYRVSNWSGNLPGNPASSREDCLDSNSADPSADCLDNRPERNPESNRESNGADCSESYLVDSLPDCLASYPERLDPQPVCRSAAATTLLQLDDLADGLCLSLCLCFADEADAGCQRPDSRGHRACLKTSLQHLRATLCCIR